jgi:hypothetical protein
LFGGRENIHRAILSRARLVEPSTRLESWAY